MGRAYDEHTFSFEEWGYKMKKARQLLALVGVVIIVILYLTTIVFALLGREFMNWLMAALAFNILLAVILWLFSYLQKHKKGDDELELFRNLKKKDRQ